MAKPAPAPIRVPGHHISTARFYQGFDLRQTFMGADIDPMPFEVLATDASLGHGRAQQRCELERTGRATVEQARVQDGDAAIGQVVGRCAPIVNLSVGQDEIAVRVMLGIIDEHQVRQPSIGRRNALKS